MKIRQVIGLIARILVGGVLFYSGFSKLIGPTAEFAGALAAYKILPGSIITPLSNVWPWVELFIGTFLVFGYFTRWCAIAAVGMFVVFETVLISTMIRHIDLGSCGCFGAGMPLSVHTTASLDGVLIALSILVYFLSKTTPAWSADAWIEKA